MAQSTKRSDAGRVPGPVYIPNVIAVQLQYQLPNTKIARGSLHGFNATSVVINQALANSLFASISSAWNSNLGTYMHASTVFQAVNVWDMTNNLNPVFFSVGTAVPGTGAGAAMPENNAIVMTENVQGRGRGSKGRLYLGGFVQSADVTVGGISPAVQTAINNFGSAVFSALSGANLTPCVAQPHRQAYTGIAGAQHNDRPAGHVNVTSYVCRDLVWDTQRRRVQL